MSWTFMGSDGSSTPAAEQDRADHQKQVLALHAYVSRLLRGTPSRPRTSCRRLCCDAGAPTAALGTLYCVHGCSGSQGTW